MNITVTYLRNFQKSRLQLYFGHSRTRHLSIRPPWCLQDKTNKLYLPIFFTNTLIYCVPKLGTVLDPYCSPDCTVPPGSVQPWPHTVARIVLCYQAWYSPGPIPFHRLFCASKLGTILVPYRITDCTVPPSLVTSWIHTVAQIVLWHQAWYSPGPIP